MLHILHDSANPESNKIKRITEWNKNIIFEVEGTHSYHLVQQPDHFRAHQKLKHVIKGTVQMPLKH